MDNKSDLLTFLWINMLSLIHYDLWVIIPEYLNSHPLFTWVFVNPSSFMNFIIQCASKFSHRQSYLLFNIYLFKRFQLSNQEAERISCDTQLRPQIGKSEQREQFTHNPLGQIKAFSHCLESNAELHPFMESGGTHAGLQPTSSGELVLWVYIVHHFPG